MHTKTLNILILGDSWGKTWYDNPQLRASSWEATHCVSTLAMLLKTFGHTVCDCTEPGGSWSEIFNRWHKLDAHRKNTFDLIVCIQTSPMRDVIGDNNNLHIQQLSEKYFQSATPERYERDCERALTRAYTQLEHIVNKCGAPCLLSGGCSKVQQHLIQGSTRITTLIPSIPEYLLKLSNEWFNVSVEYTQHVDLDFSIHTTYLNDDIDTGMLDLIYERHKVMEYIREQPSWRYWFFPDRGHPNINAHMYIVDEIQYWIEQNFEQA